MTMDMTPSQGIRLLAAASLLALALGGCASVAPGAQKDPRTPTEQFTPAVAETVEEIRLAVHAQGPSETQDRAIIDFARAWREAGGGGIRIRAPSVTGDAGKTFRMAEAVRTRLISTGVPEEQVEVVGYTPEDAQAAPLVIGYRRHQVSLPQCGQLWTNLTSTGLNRVQPNFGCATSANMAAQIANPADLVAPRPSDPADSARRAVVLDKYRQGEVTSAAVNEQAQGAVSDAVR